MELEPRFLHRCKSDSDKGNDPDEDSDREQPLPVRPVDKPVQRTGKRNVEPEAPVRAAAEPTRGGRGGRGGRGRRDNISGNEGGTLHQ